MKKLIILALFILILMFPFFAELIFHKAFFSYEYNKIAEPAFSKDEYLNYTSQVIKYLFNFNKKIVIYNTKKELQGFFTEDEINHMKDVKNIFSVVNLIYFISLIFAFFKRKEIKSHEIRKASLLVIIFIIILVSAVIINFDYAFVLFHKVLFRNNLWLLPEDSSLIKLFPSNIFFDFTIIWFISAFIIALLLIFYQNRLLTSRN